LENGAFRIADRSKMRQDPASALRWGGDVFTWTFAQVERDFRGFERTFQARLVLHSAGTLGGQTGLAHHLRSSLHHRLVLAIHFTASFLALSYWSSMMRLTMLSMLVALLFSCLVDSTYGQAKSDIWEDEADDFIWERIWGEESGDFIWREEDAGGDFVEVDDDETDDRAPESKDNLRGSITVNLVNVKSVMTGSDRPLIQNVTILPERFIQTAASGGSGAVDHNTTRSNMGFAGSGDGDGQLKHGNDKVVRKKPN